MPADPSDAMAATKRWRFVLYLAGSVILCAVWLVVLMGGGPKYDPNRRPDLVDFTMTVCGYLLVLAVFGLFAVVVLLGGPGRVGRRFFIGATVFGAIATTLALTFDLTFSGIDCRRWTAWPPCRSRAITRLRTQWACCRPSSCLFYSRSYAGLDRPPPLSIAAAVGWATSGTRSPLALSPEST